MATVDEIAEVRRNVNEPTQDIYTDDTINNLINSLGMAGASAKIWREKAARYSELVNASESGASHAYSDLHRAALAMAADWDKKDVAENGPLMNRPVVHKIERS